MPMSETWSFPEEILSSTRFSLFHFSVQTHRHPPREAVVQEFQEFPGHPVYLGPQGWMVYKGQQAQKARQEALVLKARPVHWVVVGSSAFSKV